MHGIEYDEIHDEIVVPQPFAVAILTFRGGANGDEAPIRVIQGPQTQLINYSTDQVEIDPVHNEIFVLAGYPNPDHILVFAREANGNVAPIRVLKGPDAFRRVDSVAVDPVRNVLLVSGQAADGTRGVIFFDRTAQGNAKPRGMVIGPTGRMTVAPEKGLFLVVIKPPRSEGARDTTDELQMPGVSAAASDKDYVGVWSMDDRGAAPPRWMIGGPSGILQWIFGLTLNPKEKTVIVTDMRLNAAVTYAFSEIF